jgi:hypothetical protein
VVDVRTEKGDIARLQYQPLHKACRLNGIGIDNVAIPPTLCDEAERSILLGHLIHGDHRLNVTAVTVYVGPLGRAVSSVSTVLMPRKSDLVTGKLKVRLVDQLAQLGSAQQLSGWLDQSRIPADPFKRRLATSSPDDAINTHLVRVGALAQDESGVVVIATLAESLGAAVKAVKFIPHRDDLGERKERRNHDPAKLKEGFYLSTTEVCRKTLFAGR